MGMHPFEAFEKATDIDLAEAKRLFSTEFSERTYEDHIESLIKRKGGVLKAYKIFFTQPTPEKMRYAQILHRVVEKRLMKEGLAQ